MKNDTVVITGIGVVSPFGRGTQIFKESILNGKDGRSQVKRFNVEHEFFRTHYACNVNETHEALDEYDLSQTPTIGVWAAQEALNNAKLCIDEYDPYRIGVSMGTSSGGNQSIARYLQQKHGLIEEDIDYDLLFSTSSTIAGKISSELQLKGLNATFNTACSSGTTSIGFAMDMLQKGKADVMLAGGADLVSEVTFSGFNCLQSLAPEMCQPFSKNRKGLMLGEGSTVFVLEKKSDAEKRNAYIYGEILGYSAINEAYHETSPNPSGLGAYRVMKDAIDHANIRVEDVDYINMHGTSTPANDSMELSAVKQLFEGVQKDVKVSSTKSMIGHLLGAAGSIELAATILAMEEERLPPTIHFDEPMPEFADMDVVPNKAIEYKAQYALSNSFAFAGHLATIVIKKYQKGA